eukprot:10343106-Alexandrium_andersonii.AAC.1
MWATEYGLRTDYGLPLIAVLGRLVGLQICPGPGTICIRPASERGRGKPLQTLANRHKPLQA